MQQAMKKLDPTTLIDTARTVDAPLAVVPPRQMTTPGDLLQSAVAAGATIEQMERLMEMKRDWERDEARKAFNAAFAAFKAEAVKLVRMKNITDGPLKGKKHLELADAVEAVTPALSRYGLSAAWKLTKDDKDWMEVTCTLSHVAGHSESVAMGGPPDAGPGRNAMQARGSTKTYLERYTLTAITGLAASDADDDGAGGPKVAAAADEARLGAGRAAAKMGTKAYGAFFKNLTPGERTSLRQFTDELKGIAQAADAATTQGAAA